MIVNDDFMMNGTALNEKKERKMSLPNGMNFSTESEGDLI
jgi:hypothetical protein